MDHHDFMGSNQGNRQDDAQDPAKEKGPFHCPHCQAEMRPWSVPGESTWGEGIQYVCFNDECPYFLRGWQWMKTQYNAHASYRYRLNPQTGEKGPLPVWSVDALKNQIVEEDSGDEA